LVSVICAAFADCINQQSCAPVLRRKTTVGANQHALDWEDWVWTTHAFGRTQYALLRTMVGGEWKTPEFIPTRFRSVEVHRRQQQASIEATPHLKNGVFVGVRLLAGLDYLLQHTEEYKISDGIPNSSSSLLERRIMQYWPSLLASIEGTQMDQGKLSWLWDAWQAGPSNSRYDLSLLLQCPIYQKELADDRLLTPLSHPEESLHCQIRNILKKGMSVAGWEKTPSVNEVDDYREVWMNYSDEDMQRKSGNTFVPSSTDKSGGSQILDDMLHGVQSFIKGSSSVEGVTHEAAASAIETPGFTTIDPCIFLNILHATLRAQTVDDLRFLKDMDEVAPHEIDPYFSSEDYDVFVDERNDDDIDMNDDDAGEQANEMVELMEAMDHELSMSRSRDGTTLPGNDHTSEGSHVLANLMQSLEASGGGPGPVRTMLSEMGVEIPSMLLNSILDEDANDQDENCI